MDRKDSWKERNTISTPFQNLEGEKQKRIINAALKEFAAKGFEAASTNQIVKGAQIGKGMLFYYFNNKQDLFYYLIDYCMETIANDYIDLIDTSERDFFQRMRAISKVKMDFLRRYPDAMNFLSVVFLQDFEKLSEQQQVMIEKFQQKMRHLTYGNIDFTLFRHDIDAEKAFRLIQWTFKGYEEEMKYRLMAEEEAGAIDYTPYFEEFFTYLDVLQQAFYKKGAQSWQF